MQCFSYVVARDYGFAPNPFHGYCTLAACKQKIRESANVGDWIVGFAPRCKAERKVVYLMCVNEKISFNEYWQDERFALKKANVNSTLIRFFGDNIYHQENQVWVQENSHHSYIDGTTNEINLRNDVSGRFVLISSDFYYFGEMPIVIPANIDINSLLIRRGHKRQDDADEFMPLVTYIRENYSRNFIYNVPHKFRRRHRYKGRV